MGLKKNGKKAAAIALAGLLLVGGGIGITTSMVGCSNLTGGSGSVINANTVAAIVNLAIAFYGGNANLTPAQLAALEAFLTTAQQNKSLDVMVLVQMLVSDGVIPVGKSLTPTQLAAIIGLLDTLGFTPTINGQLPSAEMLAPPTAMQYSH